MSTAARNINSAKPFRRAVETYRERGWLGTLPLPPRSKEKPPSGFTGRAAPYPTDDDVASWLRMPKYAQGNICLHLGPLSEAEDEPYELIGIDVDDYVEGGKRKQGGKQLAALEAELGALPGTWTSSSRDPQNPSGIRFFRVPAGLAWVGKADAHIDIIQKCHRYAIVFPSWHPGEKDEAGNVVREGGQYKWTSPRGKLIEDVDGIPDVSELATLPQDWVDRLTRGGMKADVRDGEIDMDLSVDEMFRWAVGALPGSDKEAEPCSKMKATAQYWMEQIAGDASSHDKITGAHWNLIAMASEGHTGWRKAVADVENFIAKDTIKERGKRTMDELRREIGRSKINALRKIKAQLDSGRRRLNQVCTCYEPSEDEIKAFSESMSQKGSKDGGVTDGNDDWSDDPGERTSTGTDAVGDGAAEAEFNAASLSGRDGYWPSGIPGGKPKDPSEYDLNDRGNGAHWADLHKDNAFYVPALADWIMWTGRSWILGDGCAQRSYERVERRQGRYAEQLWRRARQMKNDQDPGAASAAAQAKRWANWSERSGNVGPIDSALKAAQARLSIDESSLNADPALICCENGVLELDLSPLDELNADGSRGHGFRVAGADDDSEDEDLEVVVPGSHVHLREVQREDLLTLNTGCNYLPWNELVAGEFGRQEQTYATLWAGALENYLPDPEVRRYLQKLLGYSLLGDNRNRIVVFLHGPTGSGKSTFLNAVMAAFGDYADVVDLSIFKGDRQTNPALAYALPKRIVTASEASQRNVLHADMFKRITGGDPITAELKYANEQVKRKPAFVPWIATNTPPSIPGADAAVVARTIVVPFSEQIKFEDVGMNAMLSSQRAKTAVLAWAVEGWGMYRREGLRRDEAPAAVRAESAEFSDQFSDVSEFLRECVARAEGKLALRAERRGWKAKDWPEEWRISAGAMYDVYVQWCIDNRVNERQIMKKNGFSRQLKDYGFHTEVIWDDGGSLRVYAGMQLINEGGRVFKLHKGEQ